MPCTTRPRFRKSLLAMAASATLAPYSAWALDLAQEPPLPTVKSSFIAPNVIISVDDSGSMDFCLNVEGTSKCDGKKGADNVTTPLGDGSWPVTRRRMNVLKYTLAEVFNDKALIPENKIRLGWQVLHNNGSSPGAKNINSATIQANSVRRLDTTNGSTGKIHRQSFLDFVNSLKSDNGTPAHRMFSQADGYMRRALSKDGPWANDPGGDPDDNKEYLGCRRNYHIMMTDGRWNSVEDGGNQDGLTQTLGDDLTSYNITSDQTHVFRDTDPDNLADWAFKSWAVKLQSSGLTDADKLKPPQEYDDAPATETFVSSDKKKTVVLNKFWNPKYNPATWPHMVTYTIGFSNAAVTWPNTPSIVAPTDKTPFGYDGSFADLVTGKLSWPALSKSDDGQNNDHALDLWHAAINGRGRFYGVTKGEDLKKAFTEIIGKINADSATLPDTVLAGSAASGFSTTRGNVGNFSSSYNGKDGWKGWVTAYPARDPVTGPCPYDPKTTCTFYPDPTKDWEGKTTADRLDDLPDVTDRVVLSWSDEWVNPYYKGGVPFRWANDQTNLSSPQKALLGKETSDVAATVYTKGENVLNYIRGDRTKEGDKDTKGGYTATLPFRERSSRQGDIINSDIWYTGAPASGYSLLGYSKFVSDNASRTPMLYVGGNDGMLHGFSAKDGKEKIAYVPRGVISDLKKLADPDYNHQYFVDGSPMTGDISDSGTWRTMLVGTLGAGGKGYFVLDVTDPSSFLDTKSAQLVARDRTRGNGESPPDCGIIADASEKAACTTAVIEDKDIGNITMPPVRDSANPLRTTQIARLNNNRWAAVMGNGYNSANQRPVLLVQYLDGAKELLRIPVTNETAGTGNAADNGLAAPTLVDLNGDMRVDIVYAGDNLGNLWKFDLTSELTSDWQPAFGANKPLFTARGSAVLNGTRNLAQPVTAPPIVRPNDRSMVNGSGKTVAVGGMMVSFGTGRNLTKDDRDVNKAVYKQVQTLYSVLDNARYEIKDKGKPKDDQRLKIHPGLGDIPTPKQVGTMGSGAKLAQQAVKGAVNQSIEAKDVLDASTWKDFDGWYLDFPEVGERLLKPMQFWDGSNILAVYSEEPSGTSTNTNTNINESCTPTTVATVAGLQYRTLINIMDGKNPSVQLVNGVPTGTSRIEVPMGTPTLVTSGKKILDYTGVGPDKKGPKPREDNRMPEQSLRPSWRQVK